MKLTKDAFHTILAAKAKMDAPKPDEESVHGKSAPNDMPPLSEIVKSE